MAEFFFLLVTYGLGWSLNIVAAPKSQFILDICMNVVEEISYKLSFLKAPKAKVQIIYIFRVIRFFNIKGV